MTNKYFKSAVVIVLLIAQTASIQVYIRVATGRERIGCVHFSNKLIPLEPSYCNYSDKTTREVCIFHPNGKNELSIDPWICISTEFSGFLPKSLVVFVQSLHSIEGLEMESKKLFVPLKVTKLEKSDVSNLEWVLGLRKDPKYLLGAHIWSMTLDEYEVTEGKHAVLTVLPASLQINSISDKMFLHIRAIVSPDKIYSEQLKRDSGLGVGLTLIKISLNAKSAEAISGKQQFTVGAQFLSRDSNANTNKSSSIQLTMDIPEDIEDKSPVEPIIQVKSENVFNFLFDSQSENVKFNAFEYNSGKVESFDISKWWTSLSNQAKGEPEYNMALFLAADLPENLLHSLKLESFPKSDDENISSNGLTLYLGQFQRFGKEQHRFFKSKPAFVNNYGVSVYELLEVSAEDKSNTQKADLNLELNSEMSRAKKITTKASKKNSQCNVNLLRRAKKIDFSSESIKRNFVCAEQVREKAGMKIPCSLSSLIPRIKADLLKWIVKVGYHRFAISDVDEGDRLCTDGIKIYYVHFEVYNSMWSSKPNKFEDYFGDGRLLV